MSTPEARPPEPGPDASIGDIQADIERTRQELSATVGTLSEKLDVKKQTQQKATELREKATPAVPIAVLVAVVAVVGLIVWRRRRG